MIIIQAAQLWETPLFGFLNPPYLQQPDLTPFLTGVSLTFSLHVLSFYYGQF